MIAITTTLIFWAIGLFFLIRFSWMDLKTSEVENKEIMPFLLIGVVFSLIINNLIVAGCLCLFMGILGAFLWKKNALGGADVKILAVLPLYLQSMRITSPYVLVWFFLILFLVLGSIYGLTCKYFLRRNNVPFVPVITICYVILYLI